MHADFLTLPDRLPHADGRSAFMAVCCLAAVVLAIVGGCRPAGPAVEYVEGRVLVDGEPVADATVGFSPAGGAGLAAFGQTDASGTYRLTTVQGGKKLGGAAVGDYVVTVKKYRNRIAELPTPPDEEQDPKGYATFKAELDRLTDLPSESLVPATYVELGTSPLRASVAKGKNVGPGFTFELTRGSKER